MSYLLDVSPEAQADIKRLPGHMRQRVRREIASLVDNPRPDGSKPLAFEMAGIDPRRLRIERWRVVYAVIETDLVQMVAVVAVRKRPPYGYNDLDVLFGDF